MPHGEGLWGLQPLVLLIRLAEPLSLPVLCVLSGDVGAASSCQCGRSLTSVQLEACVACLMSGLPAACIVNAKMK